MKEGQNAILLVDDEAIILLSLRTELRAEFGQTYRYEIALDAAEARTVIDELAAEGVEVILVVSDWLMPGTKGDDFLTGLRKSNPDISTILVTGQADEGKMNRMREEGIVDSLLRKPWSPQELIATCREVLKKREGGR